MAKPLQDQVALVTGAGRGIGRAVALALAGQGAEVVLSARSEDQLAAVAAEIAGRGGRAAALAADLSRSESVASLFARLEERFGRLDILVNNAGVGAFGPLEDFPLEELDRILSVNVRGTFLACQGAVRLMKPRGRGTIINVSSVVGFKGYPQQAAYTASKHGVMGLTRSLAAEVQPSGIRVSAVLPGGVDTDLARKARPDLDRSLLLQPEDVAQVVLFLLSLPERAAIDEIYIRRRSSQPF